MISFRAATEADARAVELKLRPVDSLEVTRAGGTPHDACRRSLRASLIAWTMLRNGHPIALFGAVPNVHGEGGVVWLLGTPELTHAGKALVQKGRYYVDLMHRLFPILFNAIDPENKRTARWLATLGFRKGNPVTMPTGYVFNLIVSERTPHV